MQNILGFDRLLAVLVSLLYLLAGELTSTGLRLLEDAWYPYCLLVA